MALNGNKKQLDWNLIRFIMKKAAATVVQVGGISALDIKSFPCDKIHTLMMASDCQVKSHYVGHWFII